MNRKILLFSLSIFSLSVFSCGSSLPGRLSPGEFSRLLQSEPANLIRDRDFSLFREKQMRILGGGDTLSLGMLLLESERPEEGIHVLSRLAAGGESPWKQSARVFLTRYYRIHRVWDQIEDSEYALESLFYRKKDDILLKNFPDQSVPDPQLLYFRGIAALRSRGSAGMDDFLTLFFRIPAGTVHREALEFLTGEGLIFPDLIIPVRGTVSGTGKVPGRLVQGKIAVLDEDWRRAVSLLENLLGENSFGREGLVEDLISCFRRLGRLSYGAELFLTKAGKTGDRGFYIAAGRLLRWAGRYTEAAEAFERARVLTPPGNPDDERVLWYLVDCRLSAHPKDSLAVLQQYAASWHDREYFDDLVEKIITWMAAQRSWGKLEELTLLLREYGTPVSLSRTSYILARLSEEGIYSPVLLKETPADLFRQTVKNDPWGYYGWLSRLGTGDPGSAFSASGPSDPPVQEEMNIDPVFSRLIAAGRTAEAGAWYREGPPEGLVFSRTDILALGRLLQKEGAYLESLRFLAKIPLEERISRTEWEIRFPRGYLELVEEIAGEYEFTSSLLLGLIREESAFTSDIVSHAGAVGLGQLMPSTARDVASRMDRELPDLTDPRSNLVLSAWYLDWLMEYVGGIMPSILAYNGGPGRIRNLREAWGGMPMDLAIEGILVNETRRYGRKVLVSSLFYGYLYYQISPEETIRSFFPDL